MRFEDLDPATSLVAELTKTLSTMAACFILSEDPTRPDPFKNVHVDIRPHGRTSLTCAFYDFYDFDGKHPSITRLVLAELFLAKIAHLEKLLAKIDLDASSLMDPHVEVLKAMRDLVKSNRP